MDPILDPLNDKQREAVLHIEGPMLVLAGAGSCGQEGRDSWSQGWLFIQRISMMKQV